MIGAPDGSLRIRSVRRATVHSCDRRALPTTAVMANVSRGLIALLVGTVAFFALWTVALKKSSNSSSSGTSKQALGGYQSAINQAHQAVATANATSAAQGGTVASTPSATTTPTHPATTTTTAASATAPATLARPKPAAKPATSAAKGQTAVASALAAHKVVALLFYNPRAADDKAVEGELSAISTHQGRVFKLAVPLSQLTKYSSVTNRVPVSSSPTLVLIDRHQQASTLVGFASGFEIAQRVSDALATK
jgi:cytoskeletal protein RodZ